MAEAQTPTPTTTGTKSTVAANAGPEKQVLVTGKVVDQSTGDTRTPEQKKADEAAEKRAREAQEKEQKFFDEITDKVTDYFSQNTVSNRRRDDFLTRLSRSLRKVKTVAAAAKVRGPAGGVAELPAENGPGVQTVPAADLAAGKDPKSGDGMPTANPNPAPGTKQEDKK